MNNRYRPMDAQLKTKWVEALESGYYEQGHGVLRTRDDKFCCLGVLYNISGLKWCGPGSSGDYETAPVGGDEEDADTSYTELTPLLLERFGLASGAQQALIDMNDSRSFDFKRIATWIKENL